MEEKTKKLNSTELEKKFKANYYIVWYSGNLPKTITRVERIISYDKHIIKGNKSRALKLIMHNGKPIEYSNVYIKSVYNLGLLNILTEREYKLLFKDEYITIKSIGVTSNNFYGSMIKKKLFNDMFKTYVEHHKLFVDLIK